MRRASCFDEVGEVWSGGAGARAAPMRAVRANLQEALRDERIGHGRENLREERLLGVACANSSGERDRKLLHRQRKAGEFSKPCANLPNLELSFFPRGVSLGYVVCFVP